uniref:Uncharacterized protein n=1 Tax=Nelumbo nucifera TaxID=4432 RepID=A0A822XIF7_NELNU|nr:TPA_asm: hypothetical protein HUJ06_020947 [Nelumbo nucifera]
MATSLSIMDSKTGNQIQKLKNRCRKKPYLDDDDDINSTREILSVKRWRNLQA